MTCRLGGKSQSLTWSIGQCWHETITLFCQSFFNQLLTSEGAEKRESQLRYTQMSQFCMFIGQETG